MKYLVITRRTPRFRTEVLQEHYAFLADLRIRRQLETSGPFGDGSGGAYVLIANTLDEARKLAFSDPLHVQHCSVLEILEWRAM
jgi:uncharacterized protein YciI